MARKRTAPKKDFIAYKNGWQLKIMPQTSQGWKHMAVWTLILLLPTIPYGALAAMVDDTPNEAIALWALVPYFLILGLLMWWDVQMDAGAIRSHRHGGIRAVETR